MTDPMHQPVMTPFVVEFAVTHTQSVGAIDIDMAAAVAAAIAQTNGYKVLGVYARDVYDAIQEEQRKGKALGKG
jgi:hypothetical protein